MASLRALKARARRGGMTIYEVPGGYLVTNDLDPDMEDDDPSVEFCQSLIEVESYLQGCQPHPGRGTSTLPAADEDRGSTATTSAELQAAEWLDRLHRAGRDGTLTPELLASFEEWRASPFHARLLRARVRWLEKNR